MYSKIISFKKTIRLNDDIINKILLLLLNPIKIMNSKNIYLLKIYIEILPHNINTIYKSLYNKTLLQLACNTNFADGCKLLINNGSNINQISTYYHTAFIIACRYEFKNIINYILYNTNINLDLDLSNNMTQGQYAIHICIIYTDTDIYPKPSYIRYSRNKIDIVRLIIKKNILVHPLTLKLAKMKGINLLFP